MLWAPKLFDEFDRRALSADALDLLTMLHEHSMRSYLVGMAARVLGEGDAEDAVQEFLFRRFSIVLGAWRRGRSQSVAFSYYLRKSLKRFCGRRRDRRRALITSLTPQTPASDSLADWTDYLDRQALLSLVRRGARRLKLEHRKALHLYYVKGMPDQEIAVALGIDPRHVRVYRFRALQELRAWLALTMYGLTDGQISDWPGFCALLVDAGRDLSPTPALRVWQLLDCEGQRAALLESIGTEPNASRREALLTRLNAVLGRPDFFVRDYFAALAEREDVAPLLSDADAPSDKQFFTIRRNRGLFDLAFNGLVRRCPWPL
jgi:RNA polymerase sigma factor (sigma-70 family)